MSGYQKFMRLAEWRNPWGLHFETSGWFDLKAWRSK
jgi:hypothetical protein